MLPSLTTHCIHTFLPPHNLELAHLTSPLTTTISHSSLFPTPQYRIRIDDFMMQTDTTPSKPFRVIIVGAGIVGLTLSHALQLAKVDHVVLEKYDRVKSVKGAALIIWPNVERIFDQFGLLPNMLNTATPVVTEYCRWPDGTINRSNRTMNRLHRLYVSGRSYRVVKSARHLIDFTN